MTEMAEDSVSYRHPERCLLCGAADLEIARALPGDALVTSDCRPWRARRILACCRACRTVQKIVDPEFEADCRLIYQGYSLYHQSNGREQQIFRATGAPVARSSLLVEKLVACTQLAEAGRLLDIGCGTGAFLRAAQKRLPGWLFEGQDIDDGNRDVVASLPGVAGFHSCSLDALTTAYDAVSLIHCLEHVLEPLRFLRQARELLKPGGVVIIQVPDFTANPFDLAVADHCLHFDQDSLDRLAVMAGLQPLLLERGVVPNELTLVAGRSGPGVPAPSPRGTVAALEVLNAGRAWLAAVRAQAVLEAQAGPLGIFGTAIAGVWLYAVLDGKAAFFVDEDPTRTGRTLFGLPVFHPDQLQSIDRVFLCLPPTTIKNVLPRLSAGRGVFLLPPDMPDMFANRRYGGSTRKRGRSKSSLQ